MLNPDKKAPQTLFALVLGLALVGVGAVQANAVQADAAPGAGDSVSSTEISPAEAQSSQDYWTPERMKTAAPGDVLVAGKTARPGAEKLGGVPAEVPATAPVLKATSGPLTPIRTIGKVFFTLGGQNYVCSGNSVSASNRSTVSTAGHCLNEGPGAYATNWVFAPAYENGNSPYGKWSARKLSAPSQWVSKGDINFDTGFAVVSTLNGKSLADVVGASGVAFNQPRGLNYTAFGYPAGAPYDGQRLWSCSGKATNDQVNRSYTTQGIPCTMTGGSSGGPWFIGSGSQGKQNSINSYGYNGLQVMYGPYWGSVIQSTYSAAAAS